MEPLKLVQAETKDHMIKAKRLKETLSEFKIDVELGEVHTGPVITRYDIHPAAGVRVEKIANLDKNLAMALRAESVRILAPVPGKGCVGIEVPNELAAPVCLKEILQSKAWADANAEIPIVCVRKPVADLWLLILLKCLIYWLPDLPVPERQSASMLSLHPYATIQVQKMLGL